MLSAVGDRRLLTVTGAHPLGGHGLWLDPPLPVHVLADVAFCARLAVEVRLPGGTKRRAEARVLIPRRNPQPASLEARIVLRGIELGNVPPGSEVWLCSTMDRGAT